MLQVAGGNGALVGETEDTSKESVIVGSQECLLSSSDEGNEGLGKFLYEKQDFFSGEGLERIVEVDPTVVLELLAENLVDCGSTGSNVVAVDDELLRNRVEDILRSELQKKEDC